MACTPPHHFFVAPGQEFEPRPKDHPIVYYGSEEPDRPFIVIGFVNGYDKSTKKLIPLFEKLARQHGGDGLLRIEVAGAGDAPYEYKIWEDPYYATSDAGKIVYKAKVIRFADPEGDK